MPEGSSAERVPPHSQEAEVAVLGAILLEPKAMSAVAPALQADYFYRGDHQKLYTAFVNLYTKNQPIDVLSVREELRRMKAEDLATNADLFVTLSSQVPSAANAEHYAGLVRDKYLLRSLITACNESLVEAYDERAESGEILDRAEQRVFKVATRYETRHPVEIRELIQGVVDTIMNHPESLRGVPSQYPDLDHMTGGFHRGELVIVGGRPSSGKTTFALNLIERMGVRQGRGILLFSLEMPREQIVQNLLCCTAGMDSTPLRTGQIDRTQWQKIREAASILFESPIFVDDSTAMTCTELRGKARRLVNEQHHKGKEIELIVIDYLQLMSGERRGREVTRLQEITDISRALKALAKDLNVPVVALSQLSRAAEGEATARPRMSHLRESGSIEQDADVIFLLYRDDQPGGDADSGQATPTNVLTELILAKQRHGPTGTVKFWFDRTKMRFEPWSPYDAAQIGVTEEESDETPNL